MLSQENGRGTAGDDLADRYDEVPYPGQPYLQTHPDRLATVAVLLGLRPPPVGHSRVLEIGCGDGANLLPMAVSLPESRFLGIDLASSAIAAGQATIAALDLANIELRRQDVMDLPADAGHFDYIIAHGIFSWAPPAVQERILQVCAHHLAPNGVALISFNALPGWRMMGVVRDLLRFGTRHIAGAQPRAEAALRLLERLAAAPPAEADAYQTLVVYYAGLVRDSLADEPERRLAAMHHDLLAPINEPLLLSDFAARAARHGLRYLADANFPAGDDGAGPLHDLLADAADDRVVRQQALDLASGRQFHQALLCHVAAEPTADVLPQHVQALALGSSATARPEQADPSATIAFQTADGAAIESGEPLVNAAMQALIERCPAVIPFPDLLAAAASRLGLPLQAMEPAADQLAEFMLAAHRTSPRLISLHAYAPRLTPTPGARPLTSPLARLQARAGSVVTNLYHRTVELDSLRRYLLLRLDGLHDRAALVDALAELANRGQLRLGESAAPPTGPALRAFLEPVVEDNLRALAGMALLIA